MCVCILCESIMLLHIVNFISRFTNGLHVVCINTIRNINRICEVFYTRVIILIHIYFSYAYICIFQVCMLSILQSRFRNLGRAQLIIIRLLTFLCSFFFTPVFKIYFKYCKNSHAFVRVVPRRHLITSQLYLFLKRASLKQNALSFYLTMRTHILHIVIS